MPPCNIKIKRVMDDMSESSFQLELKTQSQTGPMSVVRLANWEISCHVKKRTTAKY